MSQKAPIPKHRGARLFKLGQMASGVAGGMMAEGLRQVASGNRPKARDLLFTPGNAKRLANRLSEMRGAAMKIGQLLSMEAGEILPPEFVQLLEQLRESAHSLPLGEIAKILDANWGKAWDRQFSHFNFTPIAAASIGQVHEAQLKSGEKLAVKLQYPGIAQSIDSDVDNVMGLLNLFQLLPKELDLTPLLSEAKRQLHEEANYRHEAQWLQAYRQQLGDNDAFTLPQLFEALTSDQVLSMSFTPGQSIDSLAQADAGLRHRVAKQLLELALTEVFDWGLVQTDPNFANYRFEPETGRIGLLDFGATRRYSATRVQQLRDMLLAAYTQDPDLLEQAALQLGYLQANSPQSARDGILGLILTATEPLRHPGPYAFNASNLAPRMRDQLIELRSEQAFWHIPPPEILFLHRKLGGVYLLCQRLRAKVDVHQLIQAYL